MVIYTSSSLVGKPFDTFFQKTIEAIEDYLSISDIKFHILVEFSFPRVGKWKGRQCDIVILTETGFHLLELKNKPFSKISKIFQISEG